MERVGGASGGESCRDCVGGKDRAGEQASARGRDGGRWEGIGVSLMVAPGGRGS